MDDLYNEETWSRAARFLAGEMPQDEREAFERWAAADAERSRWFDEVCAIWNASESTGVTVDRDAAWRAVQERIAPRKQTAPGRPPARRSTTRRWVIPAGATVAAALVALLVFLFPGDQVDAPVLTEAQTITTARGERMTLALSDGTRIVLSVDSRLTVEPGFGRDHRDVHLEGEAQFDVVSDPGLPFTVTTRAGRVEVTGTRFVVCDYESRDFSVAVEEGTVVVRDAASEIPISAGWQASLVDGHLEAGRIEDPDVHFGWIRGRLVFRDEPLSDVVMRIERWHDVQIQVEDSVLARRKLTTNFEGNTIGEVLDVISIAVGADVVRRGEVYVLRAESL